MLSIVHDRQEADINPAERRQSERRESSAKANALRTDNTINALRCPSLDLKLRDLSDGGLLATTDTPVELGERIAIFFPSHHGQPVYDLYGRVIRCQVQGLHYRVAVQFDSLAA